MIIMDKKAVRSSIKVIKRTLTAEQKVASEFAVIEKIEQLQQFRSAQNILLYYSLPDELPTVDMLERWSKVKNIYLPRVKGDDLEILKYDKNTLQTGAFNISEPAGEDVVSPEVPDLVIVPAVAFDKRGNRVGRGKGYYDRLLAGVNAFKIGVCYSFQVIDDFEPEVHDVPVDMVVCDL